MVPKVPEETLMRCRVVAGPLDSCHRLWRQTTNSVVVEPSSAVAGGSIHHALIAGLLSKIDFAKFFWT